MDTSNNSSNIIVHIINVLCASIIVYYLLYLKKIDCKCSINYKNHYILGFNIILVFYSLFFIFTKYNAEKFPIIGLLLFLGEIFSVIFTILFVNDLKNQNCNCSVSFMRTLMYILAIIQVCIFIILLLFLIAAAVYLTN